MDGQRTGTLAPPVNRYAPPRAAVRDVAEFSVNIPADRGTRLGATILDGIIFGVMVYAPLLVVVAAGEAAAETPDTANTLLAVGGVLAVIGFIAWTWLTILYVKRNGQSIGKKITGIKVVRSDGSPSSLGRIFWMRNFVNGLIGIIPLYALVDILFIFGEERRCLHDKIADTIVVEA
jgi:uncharacterized RDD family membrane protein YckC